MPLDINEPRCQGTDCPSAMNCRRYTERATAGDRTPMAAYHLRRDAGASACDSFRATRPVSTFNATAPEVAA